MLQKATPAPGAGAHWSSDTRTFVKLEQEALHVGGYVAPDVARLLRREQAVCLPLLRGSVYAAVVVAHALDLRA